MKPLFEIVQASKRMTREKESVPTCTLFPRTTTDRTLGTPGRDVFAKVTGRLTVPWAVATHALAMAAGLGRPVDPTDEQAARRMWSELRRLSVAEPDDEFVPYIVPAGDDGLRWEGSFTPGRHVEVIPLGRGRRKAILSWDTGTGCPSWWLGQVLDEVGLARVPRAEVKRAALAGLSPQEHGRLAAMSV